ncbi:unnamed protein product, partial [Mesorhabditis belari]|uniref:RING-type domain-containing protein n=1 Tax=Mesorhabditis belari TaxID=2138241 RepID=A0AAF3EMX8_9BILA
MSLKMKVFKSLSCSLCDTPYSNQIPFHPSSPYQLSCGHVICRNCWDKEKQFDLKERAHQCDHNGFLVSSYMISSILNLLNHPSISLAPDGSGFLLKKPFNVPSCSNCHKEFFTEPQKRKPFELGCDHTICWECFRKIGKTIEQSDFYCDIKCPDCGNSRDYSMRYVKSLLEEFLEEIPEMTEQIQRLKIELIFASYREKFAKYDEEFEKAFTELEKKISNQEQKRQQQECQEQECQEQERQQHECQHQECQQQECQHQECQQQERQHQECQQQELQQQECQQVPESCAQRRIDEPD